MLRALESVVFCGLILLLAVAVLLIALSAVIDDLEQKRKLLEEKEAENRYLRETLEAAGKDARVALTVQWLESLPGLKCGNEAKVEVKLIGPIVEFLGFRGKQVRLRVPISVWVGREQKTITADWVVYDQQGKPFLVIEAKAPGVRLTDAHRDQARSYAMGLGAPFYLVTNGQDLKLYKRGVTEDSCVFNCSVVELSTRWQELRACLALPG